MNNFTSGSLLQDACIILTSISNGFTAARANVHSLSGNFYSAMERLVELDFDVDGHRRLLGTNPSILNCQYPFLVTAE
ncbi:hypothetical protein RvY_12438 [Ramazzottius varieornatus]|uniref:Uncharacterized protein n=1 Tax=Ramazzottius varieornatus TaxID=947166 RepID=A0A1D1VJI4_RAMVA|nr:hypothetical protein RvY_12438 [Ramazzottius varieornatus]